MSRLIGNPEFVTGIIEDIEISHLELPKNPLRQNVAEIEELAHSIMKNGLFHPILVRIRDSEIYEIVAGVRRYHACKSLGWRKVSCHVVKLDEKEAFEVSLIENIQRNSLNVLDEARAYKNYVDTFGWGSASELAYKMGKSVSYITKKIRLLDLSSEILDSIENSEISPSTAEELCFIKDHEKQLKLAQVIRERKLSFRKSRQLLFKGKNDESEIFLMKDSYNDILGKNQRTFDRTIVVIRIAMNRISSMAQNAESDMIFNMLMQHKKMLHEQIDMLIADKKKLSKCM